MAALGERVRPTKAGFCNISNSKSLFLVPKMTW